MRLGLKLALGLLLIICVFGCGQQTGPPGGLWPVQEEVGPPWDRRTVWGYADRNLTMYISPRFDNADPFFKQKIARVSEGGKWGVINRNGDYIVPPVYDDVRFDTDGVIKYKKNDLWGIFSPDSKTLSPARFVRPVHFKEDQELAPALIALRGGQAMWGYVDRAGEVRIIPQFTYAESFVGDYAVAGINGPSFQVYQFPYEDWKRRYGIIDKNGDFVVQPAYHSIGTFRDGIFPAKSSDGKWGIANLNGEWIVPPEYMAIRFHEEEVEFVALNSKTRKRYEELPRAQPAN